MSFILDALKKSETERQQQGSAEFSSVPASSPGPSPVRWLWILAGLLLVNFAVLIGIFVRPDETPAIATTAALAAPSKTATNFALIVTNKVHLLAAIVKASSMILVRENRIVNKFAAEPADSTLIIALFCCLYSNSSTGTFDLLRSIEQSLV